MGDATLQAAREFVSGQFGIQIEPGLTWYALATIPESARKKRASGCSREAHVYLPCSLRRRCRAICLQRAFTHFGDRAASRDRPQAIHKRARLNPEC